MKLEIKHGCPLFPSDKEGQHQEIYNDLYRKVREASDYVDIVMNVEFMRVTHYGTRKFRYPKTLTAEWVASKVAWMEKNNI
jgi:hypothetical protein